MIISSRIDLSYKLYSFHYTIKNSTESFYIDDSLSVEKVQGIWDKFNELWETGKIEGTFSDYLTDLGIEWKELDYTEEFIY